MIILLSSYEGMGWEFAHMILLRFHRSTHPCMIVRPLSMSSNKSLNVFFPAAFDGHRRIVSWSKYTVWHVHVFAFIWWCLSFVSRQIMENVVSVLFSRFTCVSTVDCRTHIHCSQCLFYLFRPKSKFTLANPHRRILRKIWKNKINRKKHLKFA